MAPMPMARQAPDQACPQFGQVVDERHPPSLERWLFRVGAHVEPVPGLSEPRP